MHSRESYIDAASVIMHPLEQATWESTWKHTMEKDQTTAASVSFPLFMQNVRDYSL